MSAPVGGLAGFGQIEALLHDGAVQPLTPAIHLSMINGFRVQVGRHGGLRRTDGSVSR